MKRNCFKWIGIFMLGVITVLVVHALLMFIIDPYQYYRKARFYKPTYSAYAERYMAPGLIKHYAYDSAIVGNSMTENFLVSDLKKTMEWNTIKLSMEGATSHDMDMVYSLLFKEKKVKNVLTTFDFFSFDKDEKGEAYPMPKYLYRNDHLEDAGYLLNTGILKKELGNIYKYNYEVKNARCTDINYAYFWGDMAVYSRQNVIRQFLNETRVSKMSDIKNISPIDRTYRSIHRDYAEKILSNFNNHLYKYIKQNPKVKFYILLPPYSMLYWKSAQYNGLLNDYNYCKEYIFKKLTECRNVRLYDFQEEKMIVENIDSFRDMTHYSHVANNFMAYNLNSNKYLVTKNNWSNAIDRLDNAVIQYKLPEN